MEEPKQPEAPYGEPLDADAYRRLPEEVKLAMLAEQGRQEAQATAYQARVRKRCQEAAIGGGVAACAIGLFVDASGLVFLLLITLAGAGAGFYVAYSRSGHLTGMVAFGGGTIGVALLASVFGLVHTDPFSYFCSWLFLIGAGALLGFAVEQKRTMTDTF
ncbi:MAG: hypothetical protein NTW87_19375 [Planctomycetota bacterium]|nr:hypothetical protein [Planctomycetota bacterium]